MTRQEGRKRSKLACQTCRDLKRRCDGARPCGTCVRFEYECTYNVYRKRRDVEQYLGPVGELTPSRSSAKSSHDEFPCTASPHIQARSVEANSCPAFVRTLALRLDPKRNPRMLSFAWNAFLGSRQTLPTPSFQSITDVVSQKRLEDLAAVYFQKIDTVYGFVDRKAVEDGIRRRWTVQDATQAQDAILCSIGALGCLFSQTQTDAADAAESALVELAKRLLERTLSDPPTTDSITAWLLRVTYLRVAGSQYTAWMASCTLMHMIDAAGFNIESPGKAVLPSAPQAVGMEMRKRIVAIAQHLNVWMSFDMGLTRVALPNISTAVSSAREGDYTCEIIELLPFSVELDPQRKPTTLELECALQVVLSRVHSSPPSVLAQCNLALCLCRRLRSMEVALPESVLQQVLMLTSNGIQAAQAVLAARAPWHQMIYVPFQIVCVLLAIDTVSSISQLRGAMQCLQDITAVYNTEATQDALITARSLVFLHQKGKEMFASALGEILKNDPTTPVGEAPGIPPMLLEDAFGTGNFTDQFFGLPYNDIDQLVNPDFFWNINGYGL
ncbi:hypothetical protein M441DRAFT_54936 [Trichoderma asperellum CBS 433.97]|uniref:Zn(2)-C6 fungal-type domain-containing protein n=1 Tax=Trichoderma asperellum (strain ATCC 204424 / CBS 433.97 / NBRC 101777) TaxID=1042311 RepID=A0A2T3ZG37_TRIA4|nr:hypothetical protein M441DRAFT_54936 [Trichoderma asperellum CBS 433.97]PTB43774.1 hypothetical protein M441DRAFT_54936 [Trichoderma asperellum CBS 433.97]